jgi:hypothetical protein
MQRNSEVGKSLRCRLHGNVLWSLATLVAVLLFLTGCATPIVGAKKDLLEFLRPGHTTREEVLTTLGQPSGAFEQEKILTYRLGHDEKQGYYIIGPKQQLMSWESVRYSLVLVFDSNGMLRKHSLVDVK